MSVPGSIATKLLSCITITVLVVGVGALLAVNEYAGAKLGVISDYAARSKEFEKAFRDASASQLQLLRLAVSIEARDQQVIDALERQDRAALANRETAFFNDVLKTQFNFNLFNFLTPNKLMFYRVHSPTSFGDDASRRQMVVAALTDRSSTAGMEVGRTGPELRAMTPVVKDDSLLGSVEVGTDLTRALQAAQRLTGLDYAFGVNLKLSQSLGRNYEEDTDVIQGEELFDEFSTAQVRAVLQGGDTGPLSETPTVLVRDRRPILVSSFLVNDVNDKPVARFILVHDIGTVLSSAFTTTCLVFGSATLLVLVLGLVGFWRFHQIREQFARTIAGRRRELMEKAAAYDALASSLRDVQAWKRSVIVQIINAVAEPIRAISGAVQSVLAAEAEAAVLPAPAQAQLQFADAELRRLEGVIQAHDHTERVRSELGPVATSNAALDDLLKEAVSQADRGSRAASAEVVGPLVASPALTVVVEPKLMRDAISGLVEFLWRDCRADAVTIEIGGVDGGMVHGRLSGIGTWPGSPSVIDADGASIVKCLENPAIRLTPFAATFAAMVLSRCGGSIEPIPLGERVGFDVVLHLAS